MSDPFTDPLLTPAQLAFNHDRGALRSAIQALLLASKGSLASCWNGTGYTPQEYLNVPGVKAQEALGVHGLVVTFQTGLQTLLGDDFATLFGSQQITSADLAQVPAVGTAAGQLTMNQDGSVTVNA